MIVLTPEAIATRLATIRDDVLALEQVAICRDYIREPDGIRTALNVMDDILRAVRDSLADDGRAAAEDAGKAWLEAQLAEMFFRHAVPVAQPEKTKAG